MIVRIPFYLIHHLILVFYLLNQKVHSLTYSYEYDVEDDECGPDSHDIPSTIENIVITNGHPNNLNKFSTRRQMPEYYYVHDPPIRRIPIRKYSVKNIAMRELPVREIPVREISVKEFPVQELPARSIPLQELPVEEFPVQELPVREIPFREIPVREFPVREVPEREFQVREVPEREFPVREVPEREFPVREVPVRNTPMSYPIKEMSSVKSMRPVKVIQNDPPFFNRINGPSTQPLRPMCVFDDNDLC